MKKSIKVVFGIVMLSTFITINSFAQVSKQQTSFALNRQVRLENSSDNQDIIIKVSLKECRLNLRITSEIEAGDVDIEFYDQAGKKRGNFSVGCQADTKSTNERVHGSIMKLVENPELGDWIVKIKAQKATGTVNIQYSQETMSN